MINYSPSQGRPTTGVVAPRRIPPILPPVLQPPSTSGSTTAADGFIKAFGNPAIFGLGNSGQISPEEKAKQYADDLQKYLDGLNNRNSGGGAGNPYTNAIKTLQKQLSGGGYGASFDNLSTMLGTTATGAGQRIDNATTSALAGLRSSDPMAAYQFNASSAQVPQTTLNTYLNSIGAGTSSVDSGRQLLQGMIDAQTASAGQYSAGNQQGFNLMRQSAQDALTGNQQYAQSQLAMSRQAQEMAIAQAKEKERKAIEDQILAYVLKGGRA